jgi:hypothetical protein
VSPTERKVLIFLRDHGETTARVVAEHLWPDSPGWHRTSKRSGAGGGGAYGVGLPMRAGSILGKLWKQGLVSHGRSLWKIKKSGEEALSAGNAIPEAVLGPLEANIVSEGPLRRQNG